MSKAFTNIITEFESGGRPKGGAKSKGIPSLGAEHLDGLGGFRFNKIKYIDEPYFNKMRKGIIQNQDILIVKDGATTGKISFVNNNFPFPKAAINEHLFRLKINTKKADPKYIFYMLSSEQGQRQILQDFRGATIGGISKKFVDFIRLPLPPLETQRQIANVLDKADAVRQKRRESIELLDKLLRDSFLEMFGEPVFSDYPKVKFKEILNGIDNGKSPVCENFERISEDNWAILKLSSVTSYHFKPSENKQVKEETVIYERAEVKQGDLLFTRKNTRYLVGATALVFETSPKLLLPDIIFRLNYKKEKVYGEYLWLLLTDTNFRKHLERIASGSAASMINISKQKLNDLLIPLPPIEEQRKFAALVHQIHNFKKVKNAYYLEAENLFNSLLQRAFKGELEIDEEVYEELLSSSKEKISKEAIEKMLQPINDMQNAVSKLGWRLSSVMNPNSTIAMMIREVQRRMKALQKQYSGIDFSGIDNVVEQLNTNNQKLLQSLKSISASAKTSYQRLKVIINEPMNKEDIHEYIEEFFEEKGVFSFEELDKDFKSSNWTVEYDTLKEYLFESVENGTITQVFDVDENQDKSKGKDNSQIKFKLTKTTEA